MRLLMKFSQWIIGTGFEITEALTEAQCYLCRKIREKALDIQQMENTIIITFRKQLQHMMAALCRASMMLPQTLLVSCSMVFPYMVLCSIFHHQKEKYILNQDRVREFSTQIKPFLERIFEPQLENCSDCVFKQIEDGDLDECGGQEVADGSEEDGTVYRYIASGLFPYNIQCYRGDISLSQRLRGGNWQTFRVNNSCGRGGGSENGCSGHGTVFAGHGYTFK